MYALRYFGSRTERIRVTLAEYVNMIIFSKIHLHLLFFLWCETDNYGKSKFCPAVPRLTSILTRKIIHGAPGGPRRTL
jgi:hypothetical protein